MLLSLGCCVLCIRNSTKKLLGNASQIQPVGCGQALLARDTTKPYEMAAEARQCALKYTFSFAYVWTLGGNLKVDMRPKFDSFARAQLKAELGNIPSSGTVSCEATSYTCSSTMPTTE